MFYFNSNTAIPIVPLYYAALVLIKANIYNVWLGGLLK